MSQTKTAEGSLVAAARTLEGEVARYEQTLADLARTDIVSEKTLLRAGRSLEACAEHQQRLAGFLQAFAAAMGEIQARQEKCIAATGEAMHHVKSRHDARAELLTRVAALGVRAREINEPIEGLGGVSAEANVSASVIGSLEEVRTKTEEVIAEAGALRTLAKESDWHDIERDTDALRQQLEDARNKMMRIHRTLAARAPS